MSTPLRVFRMLPVAATLGVALFAAQPLEAQQGEGVPLGSLGGLARNAAGEPLVGVQVTIEGFSTRATTRDNGEFHIAGIPAGTVRIIARRLGYLPARRELVIPVGATLRVELIMRPAPAEMAPVTVTARREPFDSRLSGFRQRAESQAAGYIFTREKIERTSNRSTFDLIRTVPGVRIVTNGRGAAIEQSLRFRSNRCPPVVFIDGFAASAAEFDLSTIDLNMVEGVEVYTSGTSLPPEFFTVARGLEQCGVIAIWSRPTQLRRPRPALSADAERAEARRGALAANAVDDVAYPLGARALEIVYPDSLWRESTAGEVTVEFVVDDRGELAWPSLKVVNETHPYFTRAVLEALALVSWEPARLGGRRVAQLVVMPVRFSR